MPNILPTACHLWTYPFFNWSTHNCDNYLKIDFDKPPIWMFPNVYLRIYMVDISCHYKWDTNKTTKPYKIQKQPVLTVKNEARDKLDFFTAKGWCPVYQNHVGIPKYMMICTWNVIRKRSVRSVYLVRSRCMLRLNHGEVESICRQSCWGTPSTSSNRWLSAKQQYRQCVCNGDTAILH